MTGLEVRKLAKDGDTLLAWTTEPEIYIYSGLPMETLKTPLVNHLLEMPDYLDHSKARFEEKPPRFLVLSNFEQVMPVPAWLQAAEQSFYLVAYSRGVYTLYMLTKNGATTPQKAAERQVRLHG